MKKLVLSGILGFALVALPLMAQEPSTDKAAAEYDKSGKRMKKGAKEAGTAMKHGEVVASGKEIGKGTGSAVKHAAKGTAEGARVVGDKTEDVAEKGAHETKKGAKKVGRTVKDALDGHDEQKTSK